MRPPVTLAAFCAGAVLSWTAAAESSRTRVIRSWPDEVVVNGGAVRGRIEIVFDYGAVRALEVSYGPDGRQLESRVLPPGFQPAPCPEEMAEARGAVGDDKELRGILGRTGGGPGGRLPAAAAGGTLRTRKPLSRRPHGHGRSRGHDPLRTV